MNLGAFSKEYILKPIRTSDKKQVTFPSWASFEACQI